jgi:hypothetical protein|tara:strand:+ start:295 stop:939 length:645 start_codon:yes stop_codon:yes gene_type:complete
MFWQKYHDILIKYLTLENTYSQETVQNDSKLESFLYQGEYILKSRVTNITKGSTSIYNNILYPKTGKNLPCLGMDLMAFFKNKVILTFDFQHPKENYDFDHEIVRKNMGKYLDNTKEIRFFEPGNHFSRYVFVRKCHMDEVDQYLPDFEKYVSTYSKLLEEFQPEENNTEEFINFDNYMLKLDPVSGYMQSNFGKEFAEKYVKEFLFEYSSFSL